MRKSNDQSIKDVIAEILETNKLKGRLDEVRLRIAWEALMGKAVANRTHNISLKDGTLTIRTTSAPLSEELHYSSDKIIKVLNKEFGEEVIKSVKIV